MASKQSRLDLFRYGIISPLVYGDNIGVRDFCEEASKKEYFYEGKNYIFSKETIRKWYYKYRNSGFDELNNKLRDDKDNSRKLNDECINYIVNLRGQYPKITTKQIYLKLRNEHYIDDSVNIQCFYRYMRTNNLKRSVIVTKERRRYEQEYPNQTWQGDTTYGPYIVIDGKKYRTYLIQFIDDNSRLIVGYGFFLSDSAINVQKVLKKAISKYGLPKQIYLDNGKSYKNNQLEIICARLGVKLTHTRAFDPAAKGKVERCFKTIKEGWMYARDWNKFASLESIEADYSKYLYEYYINSNHSELNDTPNNVWHNGIKNTKFVQMEENKLEEVFMHTETRKVSCDRTISFNNDLYEVPFKYVGQTVEIRYYVSDNKEIWVYEKGVRQEKCIKLNKVENSKVVRKNNIDYSKLVNDESDVIESGD